jgi:hypothetical protein
VSELVPQGHHRGGHGHGGLRDRARQLAEGSRAANTLKAYQSDMEQFRAWCADQVPPLEALPAQPTTVALYLAALADLRTPATLRRRIGSISVVHQLAGVASPTSEAVVRAVWKGERGKPWEASYERRWSVTRIGTRS